MCECRSIKAGAEWLARSRHHFAVRSRLQWSIDLTSIADSIGTITLSLSTAELGFVLGRAYWGHGLATEAAQAVLHHGFIYLGMREIRAEAIARNKASLRVLAKLGFRHVKTYTDDLDGELCEQFILEADRN